MRRYIASDFIHYNGGFSSEASNLRFPPGEWLYSFTIDGKLYQHSRTEKDAEGDVTLVIYISKDGVKATVFND